MNRKHCLLDLPVLFYIPSFPLFGSKVLFCETEIPVNCIEIIKTNLCAYELSSFS